VRGATVATLIDSPILDTVRLHSRVKRVPIAVFWLVLGEIVFLGGIAYLVVTFENPIHRFSFTEGGSDLPLQVRNSVFILLFSVGAIVSVEMFLVSIGRLHIGDISLHEDGSVSVTMRRGFLSGWVNRRWHLEPPIKSRWSVRKDKRIPGGSYPRLLYIRSGKKWARLGSLWSWREEDVVAAKALLARAPST